MAGPIAQDNIEATRGRISKIARIEGYLALVFVVALFLEPLLEPVFSRLPEALARAVGISTWVSIWAGGWLFAISGVRHGRGGARATAVISLVILVLHSSLILIIALH
jgi:hypothetical protein